MNSIAFGYPIFTIRNWDENENSAMAHGLKHDFVTRWDRETSRRPLRGDLVWSVKRSKTISFRILFLRIFDSRTRFRSYVDSDPGLFLRVDSSQGVEALLGVEIPRNFYTWDACYESMECRGKICGLAECQNLILTEQCHGHKSAMSLPFKGMLCIVSHISS